MKHESMFKLTLTLAFAMAIDGKSAQFGSEVEERRGFYCISSSNSEDGCICDAGPCPDKIFQKENFDYSWWYKKMLTFEEACGSGSTECQMANCWLADPSPTAVAACILMRKDCNCDGDLTIGELPRHEAADNTMSQMIDSDNDGKITPSELVSIVEEGLHPLLASYFLFHSRKAHQYLQRTPIASINYAIPDETQATNACTKFATWFPDKDSFPSHGWIIEEVTDTMGWCMDFFLNE